jgi:GNAT superfamily N-acetyltransferase
MDETLSFRALGVRDQHAIWDWLHISLWDPPPAGLRPREVLQHPAVRIYAENWGRAGDIGVVAVVGGQDAGACWMRLMPEGVGLASIDEKTPQLGIALRPEFQGRGIGTRLMQEALAQAWRAGHKKIALTVHPENHAIVVYERCGFRKVEVRRGYHLMVAARP